jgi:molecular chaperone DnaK
MDAADTKTEVESAVSELKRLLEENADTNALRGGVEKLATVSQKMGQAMYAQAQQQPPQDEAAAPPQDEEGVVDAEIVDDEKDQKGGTA